MINNKIKNPFINKVGPYGYNETIDNHFKVYISAK